MNVNMNLNKSVCIQMRIMRSRKTESRVAVFSLSAKPCPPSKASSSQGVIPLARCDEIQSD